MRHTWPRRDPLPAAPSIDLLRRSESTPRRPQQFKQMIGQSVFVSFLFRIQMLRASRNLTAPKMPSRRPLIPRLAHRFFIGFFFFSRNAVFTSRIGLAAAGVSAGNSPLRRQRDGRYILTIFFFKTCALKKRPGHGPRRAEQKAGRD